MDHFWSIDVTWVMWHDECWRRNVLVTISASLVTNIHYLHQGQIPIFNRPVIEACTGDEDKNRASYFGLSFGPPLSAKKILKCQTWKTSLDLWLLVEEVSKIPEWHQFNDCCWVWTDGWRFKKNHDDSIESWWCFRNEFTWLLWRFEIFDSLHLSDEFSDFRIDRGFSKIGSQLQLVDP